MTDQIRQFILKRGNTIVSQHYTGPIGEITYDTDLKTVRVHDGVTPGGNIIVGGNVLVSLTNEVYTIEANVANLQANVTSLQANAVSQQTSINTLFANALSQQTQINTLINAPTLGNLLITDETITGLIAGRDITLAPSGNALVSVPGLKIPVGTLIQGVSNVVAVITNLTLDSILDTSTGPGDNLNIGDYGLTNGIAHPWTVYKFTTTPSPVLQVNDVITGAGIPFNSNVQFVGSGIYQQDVIVNTSLYGNAYPPAGTTVFTTRAIVNAGMAITTTANVDITLNPGAGGNIVAASGIVPLVHNLYTLGTTTKRFKEIWLGAGTIYVLDETLGIDLSIGARDGNLYVGGAAGFTVGKFTLTGNTIALADPAEDFKIGTQTATGNLIVNRPMTVNSPAGDRAFQVSRFGLTTITSPIALTNTQAVFSIIGTASGNVQPRNFANTMIQVTGNDNQPTRVSFDAFGVSAGQNAYVAVAARAARGTVDAPSQTLAGDTIIRFTGQGWTTGGAYAGSIIRLNLEAAEAFSSSATGTRLTIATTPVGGNVIQTTAAFYSNGLNLYGNTVTTGIKFADGTVQYTSANILAINANITAINANITLANTTMRSYVDGQILAANSGVTSSNVGMKGYVDQGNTIVTNSITQANLGIIGYINLGNTIVTNSITQANLGIIGYVDRGNTIVTNSITQANLGIIGYINLGNTIVTNSVTQANLGLKGYVDSQVTAANVAWQANAVAQQTSINTLLDNAVTVINGGTGIGVGRTGSTVTVNATGVANVFGTANQITVTDAGSKNLTLSLPQSIATNSSPTFSNLTVTNLTVTGNLAYTQTGTLTGKNIYLANNSTLSSQIDGGGFYLGNIQQAYYRSFLYNLTNNYWDTGTAGLMTTVSRATDADFNGNLNVNVSVHFGAQAQTIDYPNARLQLDENLNSYSQVVSINHNNGSDASTDYVAVNDIGNDSTNYIDMGINSSTYTGGALGWTVSGANAGYLFVQGNAQLPPNGNLTLGTATPSTHIDFHTSGITAANIRLTITDSGLVVPGNINVTGNILANNATVRTLTVTTLNATTITGNINYANIYNAPVNLSQFTNDTNFANTTYVNSANVGLKGYVDLANTIQSNQINTLTANAATQSDLIIAINANVTQANLGMKGYVDFANSIQADAITQANVGIIGYVDFANSIQAGAITQANVGVIGYVDLANSIQSQQIAAANVGIIGYIGLANTIQSNQINALISNAATQSDLIIAINANITQANLGMKGYVDSSNVAMVGFVNATTVFANVGMKGYVDQQILITSSAAANANVALKGYVDQQIYITTSTAANANVALKGYVDFANTIQAGAISAANIGMQGYVDFANTIQAGSISASNIGMKGYVDQQIYITTQTAANSNIAMKGYVDNAVSTANIGMVGFVQASVFNANAGVIGYVNLSNSSMKSYVDLSNSSMKSYVDFSVNNVATYSNVQVATYLPTYNGTIGSLTTANTTMKGYVDGQISAANAAANSAVIAANVGMLGYVQYTVTQANLGIKGYVDSQVTAANVAWQANASAQQTLIYNLQANASSQETEIQSKVSNVLGTANQITATPSGANVTLSLPNLVIMPGELELAAGNATVTPLVFQSGNLNTVATPGSWEYDGRAFYATPTDSERGVARTAQMYMANLAQTMTSTTNVQPLFPQLTRGVSLNSQTRYAYRILGEIDTGSHVSSTTVSYGLALSGGATIAKHCWVANPCTGSGPQPAYQVAYQVFGNYTANTMTPSISNGAKFTFIIDGIIEMITGGNVNPQLSFSVAPGSATALQQGTFMEIWPVGTITGNVNIGNWG